MDQWQKEYITENLPNLLKDINCNIGLLSQLCKAGNLADGDVQKLNAVGRNDGDQEKAYSLLQILFTRSSAYEHLAKALYLGNQTGALLTLLYEVEINIPRQNPFQICGFDITPDDILSKPVMFQGYKFPLRDLCSQINTLQLQNLVREHLNVSLYKQILSDSPITLAIDTIPNALPYFIPRSLSVNSEVDSVIFEKREDDIFLVEGVQWFQLSRLINSRNVEIDRSSNQIYHLTARFIVLEHQDHFSDIARQAKNLVHWLRYNNGSYIYIKSNNLGGINVIKSFLKAKNEKSISQDEFAQTCLDSTTRNPILIYDSPGMGKSILLAHLARDIKKKDPHRNVIFSSFSQFIKQVQTNLDQHVNHPISLNQAILCMVTVNTFGHHITQELLNSANQHVEIFLDAFDEVPESDLDVAFRILNCISKELRNYRAFITTRPHLSGKLEETFGVLGFNIVPFNDVNQTSFFLKYWENEHNVVPTEEVKLFAHSCLKSLTSEISDEDDKIAGIPLQCKMLAEIYAPDAKRGALMNAESRYRIDSVFKMYDEYIRGKFATIIDEQERKTMQTFHIQQALQTIFFEGQPSNISLNADLLDTVYKTGIMGPNKSDVSLLEFIHRTLAEFIVTEHLAEAVFGHNDAENTESINLLFENALIVGTEFTFIECWATLEYGIVRFVRTNVAQFLNCIISNEDTQARISPNVKAAIKNSKFYNYQVFYCLINASLRSNLSSLFILFLNLFLDLIEQLRGPAIQLSFKHDLTEPSVWKHEDPAKFKLLSDIQAAVGMQSIVRTAAKYSSLELVKAACNLLLILTGKSFHEYTYERPDCEIFLNNTPVQVAARRGHYLIFKYLSQFDEGNLIEQNSFWLCLFKSCIDPPDIVKDKLGILQEIIDKKPSLLSKHALVSDHVYFCHLDLIRHLIELGADVNAKDKHNNTIAHLVGQSFLPDEYHEFLELMISKNHKMIFKKRGKNGRTAFHTALKNIELKTETLELIAKDFSVDFNDRKTWEGSELACAIRGGRSRRVLEDIVRLGGNWNNMYFLNSIDLEALPCSVEHGNVEAVKYFLSLGADVNTRYTSYLCTPLGAALEYNHIEIAQVLIQNGADVNSPFLPEPFFDELYIFPLTSRMISPLNFAHSTAKPQAVLASLENSGASPAVFKSSFANLCVCCLCFPCCFCMCCITGCGKVCDSCC